MVTVKTLVSSSVFLCFLQDIIIIIFINTEQLLSVPLCRTLAITRITPEDEAIYQCIAENSAGTNQASARLAISQGPELPEAPAGLRATALSSSSLQLVWDQPSEHVSQQIIGYVLHVRRLGGKGMRRDERTQVLQKTRLDEMKMRFNTK